MVLNCNTSIHLEVFGAWTTACVLHFYMHVFLPGTWTISQVSVLGGEPDRDALKANMDVLRLAAKTLGLRVGVKVCSMHIQALYDYMQIPCPGYLDTLWMCKLVLFVAFIFQSTNGIPMVTYFFLCQGAVADTQGWQLKRLLSFSKNRVAGRPHRPRDPTLREFMSFIGIEWPDEPDEPEPEDGDATAGDDSGSSSSSSSTSSEPEGEDSGDEHDDEGAGGAVLPPATDTAVGDAMVLEDPGWVAGVFKSYKAICYPVKVFIPACGMMCLFVAHFMLNACQCCRCVCWRCCIERCCIQHPKWLCGGGNFACCDSPAPSSEQSINHTGTSQRFLALLHQMYPCMHVHNKSHSMVSMNVSGIWYLVVLYVVVSFNLSSLSGSKGSTAEAPGTGSALAEPGPFGSFGK